MVYATTQQAQRATLRRAKLQDRYPGRGVSKKKRAASSLRASSIRRKKRYAGTRSSDLSPISETTTLPQTTDRAKEMQAKALLYAKRQEDRLRAQLYALPDELIQDIPANQQPEIQEWYQNELEQGGLSEMMNAQLNERFAQPVRDVIDKRIDELKDRAKEKAKKTFKDAFKKGGQNIKKTVYSGGSKASVVEAEGIAGESIFTTGTFIQVFQGFKAIMKDGKDFLPEGSVISWIEPPALATPSKPSMSVEGATNIAEFIQDALSWFLLPVYVLLWTLVILIIHAIFLINLIPIVIALTSLSTVSSLF